MRSRLRELLRDGLRRGVPAGIKRAAMHAAFGTMSSAARNETVVRWQMASMDWSLRNLFRAGFTPRSIVDIGAGSGSWTEAAEGIFRDASFLMIEARPEQRALLETVCAKDPGRFSFASILLGAEARPEVEFAQMSTGSSVFEERSDVPRQHLRLPMTTLDAILTERALPPPDFLKLDVQGYELEILKGGPSALASAEVVLMEVSLLPINQGGPLLHDSVDFMKSHGFVAFDICSFIRRPQDQLLWQTDMIFVREGSRLRSDLTWSAAPGS
jgi:FkbM family methyltransferase